MTQSDLLQPGWSSRFQTVNGVNLHVVEAGPTAGRPVILDGERTDVLKRERTGRFLRAGETGEVASADRQSSLIPQGLP